MRAGKGDKDRAVMLPATVADPLRRTHAQELDPETFRASIAYSVDPVDKTGELLASPRAVVQFPAFEVPHNRRTLL